MNCAAGLPFGSKFGPRTLDLKSALGALASLTERGGDSDSAARPAADDQEFAEARAAAAGEDDAYGRIVGRHQAAVARQMWRFTRDAGRHQELVQDVFVEAYLSLGKYRGRAPLEHWLTRIATRVGYRFWKAEGRRRRDATVPLSAVPDPAAALTMGPIQAAELLYDLLERLPTRDRLVLTLLYWEQCTVKEAADRTGWSQAMVKVQAYRARKKLRAAWDGTT